MHGFQKTVHLPPTERGAVVADEWLVRHGAR
jgi:hypothetical protein